MNTVHVIDRDAVHEFLSSLFEQDLHAMRILSMSNATVGAIRAASLAVHAIGAGLADAEGLNSKHAIKQVDRLLSNSGIDVWALFGSWVPFVVAERKEIVVALDWTDFDKDGQTTIAIYLLTKHGRATPLIWKTVLKSELADARNDHEDAVLGRLREVLPPDVRVTVLADRGFADQKLYRHMEDLGFDFVIRFRGVVHVTSATGETKPAADWVLPHGRARHLPGALVTADSCPVAAVVCVRAKNMKDSWCLATSLSAASAREVINLYARRFTIEEGFRDAKDPRFGLGLAATRIGSPARRDRLLLISALATALLTLLGAAGESLGMDRMLKANTVKTRTHSLFRQGLHYYSATPMMKPERLAPLVEKFAQLLAAQRVFCDVFGLI